MVLSARGCLDCSNGTLQDPPVMKTKCGHPPPVPSPFLEGLAAPGMDDSVVPER